MPIYEYSCLVTGEIKEILLPLSDYDLKVIRCPIHCPPFIEETKDGFKNNTIRTHSLHEAEKIFSTPAINIVTPATKYFRNPKTGEIKTASTSSSSTCQPLFLPECDDEKDASGQREI